MSRKDDRIWVVKYAYEMEIKHDFSEKSMKSFIKNHNLKNISEEYFVNSMENLIRNLSKIDEVIKKISKTWSYSRISKVDLAILRVAINEIMFIDIPESVAINEAVKISKEYSTKDSYKFINDVLRSFVRQRIGRASCRERV